MFGQAMAFHHSLWYTKLDLAKRVGLFISAGALSLSGALGGLISFGVWSIKNSPIRQYKILFLIEGCPSVLLAIRVALFMPRPHNGADTLPRIKGRSVLPGSMRSPRWMEGRESIGQA